MGLGIVGGFLDELEKLANTMASSGAAGNPQGAIKQVATNTAGFKGVNALATGAKNVMSKLNKQPGVRPAQPLPPPQPPVA